MRRTTMAAIGVGLASAAAAVGPAIAAPPNGTSGNGAAHSGLDPQSGGMSNCQEGGGTGANGWSMLNKTGSPSNSSATLMQGEVHLTGGDLNTGYMIELAMKGNNNNGCMMVGSLSTNGQGIGNGHIPSMPDMSQLMGGPGTYYVVLINSSSMNEQFASGDLTVN